MVERFRDRGLQTPFTTEVLAKAGVTESLLNRTLQTLKLLDLVEDDGNPTQALRDYAKAPEDEARTRFAEMVRGTYAPIFSFVDPATDLPNRIRDAFRSYEPRGQQDRMVILFLALCEYTGIISKVPKRAPDPSRFGPDRASRVQPHRQETARVRRLHQQSATRPKYPISCRMPSRASCGNLRSSVPHGLRTGGTPS